MRNDAGGLMVAPLAISSPEGGETDLVAVPNPVIASVQIIDPGVGVDTFEVLGSGSIHQGRTMGYGRCLIVDAADHDRVLAFIEGQGASIGTPPAGLERMDVEEATLVIEDSPDLPPLWHVFGASKPATATGSSPSCERSSPHRMPPCTSGPAHRARDGGGGPGGGGRRHPVAAGPELACDVPCPRQGRPFPRQGTAYAGAGGEVDVRMLLHDEGTTTAPSRRLPAVLARVD